MVTVMVFAIVASMIAMAIRINNEVNLQSK